MPTTPDNFMRILSYICCDSSPLSSKIGAITRDPARTVQKSGDLRPLQGQRRLFLRSPLLNDAAKSGQDERGGGTWTIS